MSIILTVLMSNYHHCHQFACLSVSFLDCQFPRLQVIFHCFQLIFQVEHYFILYYFWTLTPEWTFIELVPS